MFPMVGVSGSRGHSLGIYGRPFGTLMRRSFFTQRVVSLWNSLPQKVVEAKKLYIFKKQLDIALEVQGITDYGGKVGLEY